MSRRSSESSGGPYREPQADLYTVLLIIALLALIIGTLCLWGEASSLSSPTAAVLDSAARPAIAELVAPWTTPLG
ncbi:MAG: hypothetical protein ACOY3P_04485 [Planctomycetota bacterium]